MKYVLHPMHFAIADATELKSDGASVITMAYITIRPSKVKKYIVHVVVRVYGVYKRLVYALRA